MSLHIRSDGPTTRNQKRLIDQVIDQCDAEDEKGDEKIPEKVASDDDKSDDDIPDLESISSDDEEQFSFHLDCELTDLIQAPASAIYDMDQVKCILFCDGTLRVVKETDQILQLCQILRGAVFPDSKLIEQWATTDGWGIVCIQPA